MADKGAHAVVLGASIGGLLAARVLADHYETVTVVERDALPESGSRRGVPQGRHAHALLARGSYILDELFPGFSDELVDGGVPVWNDGDLSKLAISVGGQAFNEAGVMPEALRSPVYFPSRPFLESTVRQRVQAITNVEVLDGHSVVGLTSTPDRSRVTGVRILGEAGPATVLDADLVVDATGRGSRMPAFLEELGYGRPQEDELTVRLAYASRRMHIPDCEVGQYMSAIFPEPGRLKTWAFMGYENNMFILTVGSMMGLEPPKDWADMLEFGAGFAPPALLKMLRTAEPVGEISHYRVPSSRWRRYDKMRRIPQGLLAFGDAICSFNPIYGQGMTVAAIEATMLQQCLREGKRDLPRRFFDAAAKQIRVAWQTAVGSDLTLPEVVGPRPMSMRVTNAYLGWVLQAAGADPVVAGQFLRVTGMMDSPASLVKPSFMLRVAKARLRGPAVQLRAQVAGGAGDGRRLMTVTVVRRFGSPRVQPQSERSAP